MRKLLFSILAAFIVSLTFAQTYVPPAKVSRLNPNLNTPLEMAEDLCYGIIDIYGSGMYDKSISSFDEYLRDWAWDPEYNPDFESRSVNLSNAEMIALIQKVWEHYPNINCCNSSSGYPRDASILGVAAWKGSLTYYSKTGGYYHGITSIILKYKLDLNMKHVTRGCPRDGDNNPIPETINEWIHRQLEKKEITIGTRVNLVTTGVFYQAMGATPDIDKKYLHFFDPEYIEEFEDLIKRKSITPFSQEYLEIIKKNK